MRTSAAGWPVYSISPQLPYLEQGGKGVKEEGQAGGRHCTAVQYGTPCSGCLCTPPAQTLPYS